MGAEPARIVAAPRAALGGAAPKREAAAAVPLPPPPPRRRATDRPLTTIAARAATTGRATTGPRRSCRAGRPARGDDRPRDDRPRGPAAAPRRPRARAATTGRATTAPRRDDRDRAPRAVAVGRPVRIRGGRGRRRARLRWPPSAPTSRPPRRRPRRSPPARRILETLMGHLGFDARVEVEAGETSRLNVVAEATRRRRSGRSSGARASACRRCSTSST